MRSVCYSLQIAIQFLLGIADLIIHWPKALKRQAATTRY